MEQYMILVKQDEKDWRIHERFETAELALGYAMLNLYGGNYMICKEIFFVESK